MHFFFISIYVAYNCMPIHTFHCNSLGIFSKSKLCECLDAQSEGGSIESQAKEVDLGGR